jgi:carbonic anhydrase
MQFMFQRFALGMGRAAAVLLIGCADEDDGELEEGLTPDTLHWSYEGAEGPESWGTLSEEYATCSSGERQSPIDIPAVVAPGTLTALEFDYAPAPATIVDNGHTVQVNFMEGANVLNIGAEAFALLQFHFHARSEHAVAGQYKPLEMHLVHRSSAGELAVVGVFFETGSAHGALAPVFDQMASATDQPAALSADLDPNNILPASKDGWAYSGSLTTPPCTEGVRWHVLSSSLQISEAQLAAFTDLHGTSYRPVLTNGSTVTSGN